MSPSQWQQLMRRVIQAAEKLKDPRVEALRASIRNGTNEAMLRRMSIVCEADIAREFPA